MNNIIAIIGLVVWLVLLFYIQDSQADPYDAYDQEGTYSSAERTGQNEIELTNPEIPEVRYIEPTDVYHNSDNTEVEYLNHETGEIERVYIERNQYDY